MKVCPLLQRAQTNKVFTIQGGPSTSTDEKAKGVLEGTLLLDGIYVRVLFDSGASLNFISLETVEKFHLTISVVDRHIFVSNPMGGVTKLDMICKGLKIYYLIVFRVTHMYWILKDLTLFWEWIG